MQQTLRHLVATAVTRARSKTLQLCHQLPTRKRGATAHVTKYVQQSAARRKYWFDDVKVIL